MVMSSAGMTWESMSQICAITLHHIFPDRCSGTDESSRNFPFFWYPPEDYETNKLCTQPRCEACYLIKEINNKEVDCSVNPFNLGGEWDTTVEAEAKKASEWTDQGSVLKAPDLLDCS